MKRNKKNTTPAQKTQAQATQTQQAQASTAANQAQPQNTQSSTAANQAQQAQNQAVSTTPKATASQTSTPNQAQQSMDDIVNEVMGMKDDFVGMFDDPVFIAIADKDPKQIYTAFFGKIEKSIGKFDTTELECLSRVFAELESYTLPKLSSEKRKLARTLFQVIDDAIASSIKATASQTSTPNQAQQAASQAQTQNQQVQTQVVSTTPKATASQTSTPNIELTLNEIIKLIWVTACGDIDAAIDLTARIIQSGIDPDWIANELSGGMKEMNIPSPIKRGFFEASSKVNFFSKKKLTTIFAAIDF